MSRLAYLWRHPRRALTALVLALAAIGVAVGSSANFTSTSSNPNNEFTAGILTQANSAADAAILTAEKMKPGDPASTGTVKIKNTGDIDGDFTLSDSDLADTAGTNGGELSDVLQLKVEDVTDSGSPVTLYGGSGALLKDMGDISLGTFTPNEERTYKFSVTFPDGGTPGSSTTGDNAYQGSALSVTYNWTATS